LTQNEISSGTLFWDEAQEAELRKVLPATLVFDMVFDGKRLVHLAVEWEKRELFIGEPLMKGSPGTELIITPSTEKGSTIIGKFSGPSENTIIRKRLSHNEHKQRFLKWYAREDELYRRLFPTTKAFTLEIAGQQIIGHNPDFEKRHLVIGEALRAFSPGDNLLIHWSDDASTPTLMISREDQPSSIARDAMTSLRSLVTRLISRPLSEFNDGEVKGLILMLDENKNLWERLMALREENQKLKEQIATLESVFEQFSKNSFFACKKDFEDWVASHMNVFEKGIRVIHRDYSVNLPGGQSRRIDLLCQDRKGLLVAVEVVFDPTKDDIDNTLKLLGVLKRNIESLGSELTLGKLKATAIRGMLITNREKSDLVEHCLQNGVKLAVVSSGCVIDVLE